MSPSTSATHATAPHHEATARRGFFHRCLARLQPRTFALTMFETATHGTPRLSAQDQAAGNIALLMMQRKALLIEKEIVAADRARAVKAHRKVVSFDKRLREINAQLLSIG